MNALVKKEIRLLLPAWVAAMVLTVFPALLSRNDYFGNSSGGFVLLTIGLGALLLGLATFGLEFSHGTFSVLLAQPVFRLRLWRVKGSLLAVAMLSVFVASYVCTIILGPLPEIPRWPGAHSPYLHALRNLGWLMIQMFKTTGLVILVVCTGGMWTTLLIRQVGAAFWITILTPGVICALVAWGMASFSEEAQNLAMRIAMVLYCICGFLWARRMFLRAQDVPWTGGVISLPGWLGFGTRTHAPVAVPKLNPLRALIRKELQSHQITLLISAALFVSHLLVMAVRRMEYDPADPNKLLSQVLGFWWVLWFAMPLLIGSTSVAEERKFGTLESQLCLPATRRGQFTVKFFVALILGILLGGVMPWLLESLSLRAGIPGEFPSLKAPGFGTGMGIFSLIAAGITLVSTYASTLTRNLLQALGASVMVGIALGTFGVWAGTQGRGNSAVLWQGPLVIFIGLPILVSALLGLAFRNFKRLQVGWNLWWRNLLTLSGAMVVIVVATLLVWNRAWDLAMNLEPPHGPARLSGSVQPQIRFAMSEKILALLPDGRIWATTNYQLRELGEETDISGGEERRRKIQIAVPLGGTFLGESNWVQLAGWFGEVAGIKSDGSLWRIFRSARLTHRTNYLEHISGRMNVERIGTDSDWKSVAGDHGCFLALKHDGTIWGWGNNSNGQLGPGPKTFTNGPVRVGGDSDWAAIFMTQNISTGVKRDGSVWKWGYLNQSPTGDHRNWSREHPDPVRWNLDGRDWAAFASAGNFDLALKQDGTLWASENIPAHLSNRLGTELRYAPSGRSLWRLGMEADWKSISLDWNSLIALKKSGEVFQSTIYGDHLAFWGSVWKPSRHADWIAIENGRWIGGCVALAADGTLTVWESPANRIRSGRTSLLGPSRKPLWSLNIFAEAK